MSKKVTVAIAGAGIGRQHLAGYLANPTLYDVVCICDPDASRAAPLLELAECDYCENYEQALKRADVDVLDICLPPGLHKNAILQAIDAGKHVICEKPLVRSLAEVDEIIDHVQGKNLHIVPVFQYRFGNGIGKLCQLVAAGLAGTPLVASLETHWNREADYYAVPWRGKWETELGGAIVGHAIHAHDLLCQVLGPVADVQARLATRVNDIDVEDCAGIVFGMQNGALVTSSITLGSARDQSRLRFCFSNLTAESSLNPYNPGTSGWTFTARNSAIQESMDDLLHNYVMQSEGFAREFELAYETFTRNAPEPVSLADARASLELISAIYQSSREKVQVSLPLGKKSPNYTGWLP